MKETTYTTTQGSRRSWGWALGLSVLSGAAFAAQPGVPASAGMTAAQRSHLTVAAAASPALSSLQERTGGQQRLRTFINASHAQGWASLDDITRTPGRYVGKVVVTTVALGVATSPTRALLYSDPEIWEGSMAHLQGDGIGQWKPGPRLVAVRVMNQQSTTGCQKGPLTRCTPVRLELVGSQACTDNLCADWLGLPKPVGDEQQPVAQKKQDQAPRWQVSRLPGEAGLPGDVRGFPAPV